MSRFVPVDRDTAYLLPPSVQEWLPKDHLARYVVDVVEALDVSELVRRYAGRGSEAHHPGTLLGLLIYGYATGVHASRAIERASYDSVAFRFVAGNTHPDHDTIATFRRRFAGEIKAIFVQVLLIAQANGLMKLGNVALDGTKVKANASRHSALSHGHALKLKQQLQAEVEKLLGLAEVADASERPEGMDIPQELARREQRLARIEEAKAQIEASAAQDYEQAQAQFEAKQAERERRQNAGRRRPPGPPPAPPSPEVDPKAQVNLTDADSRIMRVHGNGFEQCYNAQLAVDMDSRLIVVPGLTQAVNDKQQLIPALESLCALPPELGTVKALVADNGYMSEANVRACAAPQVEDATPIVPFIAMGRERHHLDLMQRFGPELLGPAPQDPLQAMAHRLKTREGRALYALRKSTVEPVIGIIKSVMKFRQFLLRGVNHVSGEWDLVCLAYNVKRMHRIQCI
jgi:transposase